VWRAAVAVRANPGLLFQRWVIYTSEMDSVIFHCYCKSSESLVVWCPTWREALDTSAAGEDELPVRSDLKTFMLFTYELVEFAFWYHKSLSILLTP